MTSGVSGRALSRALGVSDTAVRKAVKSKRISPEADGLFDVEKCRLGWSKGTDPARFKQVLLADGDGKGREPANEGANGGAHGVRTVPVRTEDDAKAAIQLITRVLQAEGVEAGVVDFNAARTADTILKAYQRDLAIAERRKELVPTAAVKLHIEKSFISYRQAMQRLPSRHVPEMAAVLGVDPGLLDAALSKAIAAELEALSAPVVRG